ncbi:MAG: hypothetical protein K6C08_07265 [Oscillospiraceae bacterium]|nr:hypothetical protein [Oscillospiraceae bacterium]
MTKRLFFILGFSPGSSCVCINFPQKGESLWAALVDSMTVYAKDKITFTLTCGMEIEA